MSLVQFQVGDKRTVVSVINVWGPLSGRNLKCWCVWNGAYYAQITSLTKRHNTHSAVWLFMIAWLFMTAIFSTPTAFFNHSDPTPVVVGIFAHILSYGEAWLMFLHLCKRFSASTIQSLSQEALFVSGFRNTTIPVAWGHGLYKVSSVRKGFIPPSFVCWTWIVPKVNLRLRPVSPMLALLCINFAVLEASYHERIELVGRMQSTIWYKPVHRLKHVSWHLYRLFSERKLKPYC